MKYVKYVKLTESDLKDLALDKSWKGSGTKEDPLIIDSANDLPQELQILNSNLYILLEGCKIDNLSLTGSQNITVSDCRLDLHHIVKSSNCLVRNSSIRKSLSIEHSSKIKVENCEINNLALVKSFSNEISKSNIHNMILMQFSRGNVFKQSEVPEAFKQMILKDAFNKFYIYIIIFWICSLISGILMYQIEAYQTRSLAFLLVGFTCLFPLVLYAYIKNLRQMKRYPPNQII